MNNGELQKMLDGWDPELEVQLRVSDTEGVGVEDGDYLTIEGERSVLVEYGKITIIGDMEE